MRVRVGAAAQVLSSKTESLGRFAFFIFDVLRASVRRPFRFRRLLEEIEKIGLDSIPIAGMVGLFSGMVFALQSGYSFRTFHAEILVGATVAISLAREIGPVFTALMLVARSGSAMAAEIGTMAVSEEIDALSVMAVSPLHYLVVPRVLAAILVFPLLTALFDVVGSVGAYGVGVHLLGIPEGPFLQKLYESVESKDLWGGLFKAAIFGFFSTLICCAQGLAAKGGAAGVGRATTKAVVYASVMVLISDYFLTSWVLEILQD